MGDFCSEENRRHSTLLVPFSYYKCLIPDYFAAVPIHWHGEFEINHIISGCAEFICGDGRFVSAEGDIFLRICFTLYIRMRIQSRFMIRLFSVPKCWERPKMTAAPFRAFVRW